MDDTLALKVNVEHFFNELMVAMMQAGDSVTKL